MRKFHATGFSRRRFLSLLGMAALPCAAQMWLPGCSKSGTAGDSSNTPGSDAADTGGENPMASVYGGDAFSFTQEMPRKLHVVMSHKDFAADSFYIFPEYQVQGDAWRSYVSFLTLSKFAAISGGASHAARMYSGYTTLDFIPDSAEPFVMHVTATFNNWSGSSSPDSWTSLRFGRNAYQGEYACPDFSMDVFSFGFVDIGGGEMDNLMNYYPGYNQRFVLPYEKAPASVDGYHGLNGESTAYWPVSSSRFAGQCVYFDGYEGKGYGLVWEDGAARSLGFQNLNHWETICAPHLDIWYGDVAPGEVVTRRAAFIFTDSGFDGFAERRDRWLGGEYSPVSVDWTGARTVRSVGAGSLMCGAGGV